MLRVVRICIKVPSQCRSVKGAAGRSLLTPPTLHASSTARTGQSVDMDERACPHAVASSERSQGRPRSALRHRGDGNRVSTGSIAGADDPGHAARGRGTGARRQ
jgi:hypothetical protein